jgi:hypothetical protein
MRSIDIFTCSPALVPSSCLHLWLGVNIPLAAFYKPTGVHHDSASSHFALLPVSPPPRFLSLASPSPSRLFSGPHDFHHSGGHCETRGTRDPFPQHYIRLSLAQRRMHMPLLHPSLNPTKTASHVRYTRIHHTRKRRDIRRRRTHLLGRAGPPPLVCPAGAPRGPRGVGPLGASLLPS